MPSVAETQRQADQSLLFLQIQDVQSTDLSETRTKISLDANSETKKKLPQDLYFLHSRHYKAVSGEKQV